MSTNTGYENKLEQQLIPSHDDEISLTEIFKVLWDGKSIIAAITAFVILISASLVMILPSKAKISLDIEPLKHIDTLPYNELNTIKSGEDIFFPVTEDTLLNLYIQEVDDVHKWAEAVKEQGILSSGSSQSEEEFNTKILGIANHFQLIPPTSPDAKAKIQKQNWSIEYDGTYTKKELSVINDVLVLAEKNVQNFLKDSFQNKSLIYQQQIENQLEELNDYISNEISKYDDKTRNRLEYLKEQAQIARTLNIEKNTIEAQSFKSNNTIVANVKSDNSFYLRGYEAIEKELELLKNRTDKESYIPELVELYNQKRLLLQNKVLTRSNQAFKNTPIAAGNFKAAHYNFSSAKIEPKKTKIMILVISVFVGLFLGLFALLIRNAVRQNME
jgi:LPS O-antigen subunit length determinant protein (WzzB/FepE family)